MSTLRLTAFVPPFQAPFHNEREQRAEVKAMKAAARASKHAVWPPVASGRTVPAAHLKQPTLTSPHPCGWVNEALQPAWRRFAERRADSPRELARFYQAEKAEQAAYALRLAKAEVRRSINAAR